MVEASLVNYAELAILAVGVVIALIQLNNISRTRKTELETRQAQLLMQIYDRWNEKDWWYNVSLVFRQEWKNYDDFIKKYGPETNLDNYSSMLSVNAFFEGIGVLVKEKLIDIRLVDNLMAATILRYWEKIEPYIKVHRERRENPRIWQYIEYLYHELKRGYEPRAWYQMVQVKE